MSGSLSVRLDILGLRARQSLRNARQYEEDARQHEAKLTSKTIKKRQTEDLKYHQKTTKNSSKIAPK